MNITLNFEAPGQNTCNVAAELAILFGSQSIKLRVQDSSYTDDKGALVQAMTFIAKIDTPLNVHTTIEAVYALSCKFAQDCVAARLDRRTDLIGPRAAAWLPFNPDYFVEY